jgi:hypothetical protein
MGPPDITTLASDWLGGTPVAVTSAAAMKPPPGRCSLAGDATFA